MELLKTFSMEELAAQLEEAVSCALRKQINFQLVIGLFLLGSGSSKREMEVPAHTGLSISYTSITKHVKSLSKEGLVCLHEVVKTSMVQIIWDNLNITFRVSAERLKAKNHFDNSTTGTVMPVFDPTTDGHAAHGTLPLSIQPPWEHTLPVLDWTTEDVLPSLESAQQPLASCFWQMKHLGLEHIPGVTTKLKKQLEECPVVNQIPLQHEAKICLELLSDFQAVQQERYSAVEQSGIVISEFVQKQLNG
ncbi:hypothetical protein B0H11DRAFT_1905119 [Mycena galericulata]|nr:hypothetical protein B0H11DRAFT_1905119 [Mycena galericulata]